MDDSLVSLEVSLTLLDFVLGMSVALLFLSLYSSSLMELEALFLDGMVSISPSSKLESDEMDRFSSLLTFVGVVIGFALEVMSLYSLSESVSLSEVQTGMASDDF